LAESLHSYEMAIGLASSQDGQKCVGPVKAMDYRSKLGRLVTRKLLNITASV
jgi:hypothetical protein